MPQEAIELLVSSLGGLAFMIIAVFGWVVRRFLKDYDQLRKDVFVQCVKADDDHKELSECKDQLDGNQEFFEKIWRALGGLEDGQEKTREMIFEYHRKSLQVDHIILGTLLQLCRESNLDCDDIEALHSAYREATYSELTRGNQ